MNSKQVKRLRKEMKSIMKFSLSKQDGYKPDGYKPDYRVGKEVKKTVYFKDKKEISEKEAEAIVSTGDTVSEFPEVKRITIVNVAKYKYQKAKEELSRMLKQAR
ncbi:MAG TPA: hypothetical protein VI911_11570 [Patescibacteria group bacterium]|nr:hypothetical protein [Patescibacteria group bacterium]